MILKKEKNIQKKKKKLFYIEPAQEEFWIEAHTHKINQQQKLQT